MSNKRSIGAHGANLLGDEDIHAVLEPFGIEVGAALAEKIREYIHFLLVWNRKVNLTSVIEPHLILERHFGESFFAVKAVPISDGRLVDIGSGAGFPALPIKLAVPQLKITLVEPSMKKAVFLQEIVRRLNLKGVDVQRCPFQELKLPRAFADFIASRALGEYDQVLSWAVNFIKPHGRAVLWVGAKDQWHIAKTPGWKLEASVLVPKSRERMLLVLASELEGQE
jgi:16S rRNA (guanine527-N7)-methyltransferase